MPGRNGVICFVLDSGMSLKMRILVHGGVTALALATIGYALAEAAGLWMLSQSPRPDSIAQSNAIAGSIAGTLPFTLALGGFLFVLLGELLLSLWRKPLPLFF